MNELLIPYGIDVATRQIVEPEDARSGRACNCQCPSCGAPLISRHPKDSAKRIHFAHDTRHPDKTAIDECELSKFVAFTMMLSYISSFLAGQEIRLDDYTKVIELPFCCPPAELEIVPWGWHLIDSGAQDRVLGGATYDVSLSIDGRVYLVDVSHPERIDKGIPERELLENIEGIFNVSAEEYFEIMRSEDNSSLRYSESIVKFLLEQSTKYWVYHRAEKALTMDSKSTHTCVSSHPAQLSLLPQPKAPFNSYEEYIAMEAAQPYSANQSARYVR